MIGKKVTDLELIDKIVHEDVLLVQTPEGARQISINNMVTSGGVKGPTGDKGPRGDKGHTGDFGNIGPTGSKGPVGNKGLTGDKGLKGDTGNQGPVGNTGLKGPTGDKGPKGVQGKNGLKGPTGDKGIDGTIDNQDEVDELKLIVDVNHEEINDVREDANHLLYENWNLSEQPFFDKGTDVTIENSIKGRTKNVVVEGMTMQNLISNRLSGHKVTIANPNHPVLGTNSLFSIGKTYTIAYTIDEISADGGSNIILNFNSGNNVPDVELTNSRIKGRHVQVFTLSRGTLYDNEKICLYHFGNTNTNIKFISDVVILEGDWSDKEIPTYIEGIKSIGEYEDNKLLIKSIGKNLFCLDLESLPNLTLADNGYFVNTNSSFFAYTINVPNPKHRYTISAEGLIQEPQDLGNYFTLEIHYKDGTQLQQLYVKGKMKITSHPNKIIDYIKFTFPWHHKNLKAYIKNIQLEEGIDSTEYTPYIGDKREIVIPMANGLKSLPNGVKDELKDNGEVIQRIGKVILNGTHAISYDVDLLYYNRFYISIDNCKKVAIRNSIFSNNFFNMDLTPAHGNNGAFSHAGNIYLYKEFKSSQLMNQWLSENPTTVYYELEKPIIHKNIDVFNLNTYNDVTHLTTDNVIKGNISGNSNVKLGGYISKQSYKLNTLEKSSIANKHDIDNLIHYTANFNHAPFEGSDIIIDNSLIGKTKDVIIEGKTLQNLNNHFKGIENKILDQYFNDYTICETSRLKLNTEYTIIYSLTVHSKTTDAYNNMQIGLGDVINQTNAHPTLIEGEFYGNSLQLKGDLFMLKFTPTDFKNKKYLTVRPIRRNTVPVIGEQIVYSVNNILLLEGDWTQRGKIQYFEGISSVGDINNKLTISSQGKNLFNKELYQRGFYYSIYGKEFHANAFGMDEPYLVEGNKDYYFFKEDMSPMIVSYIVFYDKYMNTISMQNDKSKVKTPINCKFMRTSIWFNNISLDRVNISNNFIAASTKYEPFKNNKKELMIPMENGLKSLPSGVKDEILDNGKVIQRIGKIILNGSEDWNIYLLNDECPNIFGGFLAFNYKNAHGNLICDTLKVFTYDPFPGSITSNEEGIASPHIIGLPYFKISINRSKLISLDLEGLKDWLSKNPTTVYYELLEPIVHETIDAFKLNTYLDTTYISTDSLIKPNIKGKSLISVSKAIKSNLDNVETTDINTLEIKNMMEKEVEFVEHNDTKNIMQQDEIDMSMMSTVEIFEMLIMGTSEELRVNNTSNNNLIKAYVNLINKNKKTIDDVPEVIREDVQSLL